MNDDVIQWLCWMWAQDGERFYPPDETAWECVEVRMDMYEAMYDNDERLFLALLKAYEMERGMHARAYNEAMMKFNDMERLRIDPVELAAREHRDLMERADGEVDPIDWSWYNHE